MSGLFAVALDNKGASTQFTISSNKLKEAFYAKWQKA